MFLYKRLQAQVPVPVLLIELIEVLSSILRNMSVSGATRVCSIMLQAATLFRRCCSFKKMTMENTQDEISTYIFLKIRTILESISLALVSAGEKTLKMPSGDENMVDLYWIFSHLLQNIMPNLVPYDIIHQVTPLALERSLSFLNFDLISPLAPSPEFNRYFSMIIDNFNSIGQIGQNNLRTQNLEDFSASVNFENSLSRPLDDNSQFRHGHSLQ